VTINAKLWKTAVADLKSLGNIFGLITKPLGSFWLA
jgi:hypothetical protein